MKISESEKYFAVKNRRREWRLAFWRACGRSVKTFVNGSLATIGILVAAAAIIFVSISLYYALDGGAKAHDLDKRVASQLDDIHELRERYTDLTMRFEFISQVASNAQKVGADNDRTINRTLDLMHKVLTNANMVLQNHKEGIALVNGRVDVLEERGDRREAGQFLRENWPLLVETNSWGPTNGIRLDDVTSVLSANWYTNTVVVSTNAFRATNSVKNATNASYRIHFHEL
jgi:hypothetical protein